MAGWNIETKQTFHVFSRLLVGCGCSARCWVLRGHLLAGFSLAALGLDRLTLHVLLAWLVGVGVVVVDAGWGVVVC